MADVDFSHAVLDVYAGKPLERSDYLYLTLYDFFKDSSGNQISGGSKSIITNTPTKVSILWTGTFTASGTEFYITRLTIGSSGAVVFAWRVSNISFSNGDTFSFIIDIETSGNV